MLCNRLFEIRKDKGFTQQQLADLVGCSRQVICYIENYLMIPKVNLGLRLSQVLNVTFEELFYFV